MSATRYGAYIFVSFFCVLTRGGLKLTKNTNGRLAAYEQVLRAHRKLRKAEQRRMTQWRHMNREDSKYLLRKEVNIVVRIHERVREHAHL